METQNTDAPKTDVPAQVSKETAPKTEATPAQPLTEDRVKAMLSEHGEKILRQSQSERDKAIASVQREAARKTQVLTEELEFIKQAVGSYDPNSGEDVKTVLEKAAKDAQLKHYQAQEQEGYSQRATLQAFSTFKDTLAESIKEMGLPTDDIDWGDTSESPLDKQKRILKEVGKKAKSLIAAEKAAIKKELEAEKLKIRQDTGVDTRPEGTPVPGKLTAEMVKKMTPEERFKRSAEIAKMPLSL